MVSADYGIQSIDCRAEELRRVQQRDKLDEQQVR